MTVSAIIDGVLDREGSAYTNDPVDSGGPTKYGITLPTLDAYYRKHLGRGASTDDLQELSRTTAFDVYAEKYIREPGFHHVLTLDEKIGEELIDTGVNCGPGVATTMLQRCLNALNLNGTKYPDVNTDGRIGPRTLAAFRAYLEWRGQEGRRVLLVALNCLQGERYIDLAEKRPKDEKYVYGWLRARVTL
jgi:lysozyme family protein